MNDSDGIHETINSLNLSYAKIHMLYITMYLSAISTFFFLCFLLISLILKYFTELELRRETIYWKITANLLEELD